MFVRACVREVFEFCPKNDSSQVVPTPLNTARIMSTAPDEVFDADLSANFSALASRRSVGESPSDVRPSVECH